MASTDRAATDADYGFTLVELLVVVVLIGILITAVAAAFIVFVGTDDSVVDRLTNSSDLQNLESFLPGDVASASAIAADGSAVPIDAGSFCHGRLPAGPFSFRLQMSWDQRWRDGSNIEYEVIYYQLVGVNRLERLSCVDNASAVHTVARHFLTATVVLPAKTPPATLPLLGTVEIVLTYPDDNRRLTASSRNYLTP